MDRKTLVEAILVIEWDMFSNVQNEGGKASCQFDNKTFEIMRRSQLELWNTPLLASWFKDLLDAKQAGRNLMSEKYARMMETTAPEAYARIAGLLPPVKPEAARQIEEIVACNVAWKEDLNARYPHLAGEGRPVRSSDDQPSGGTSLETYMRCELSCFSPETVALCLKQTREFEELGKNGAEMNLLAQVRQYGYDSLESAEAALAGE